MDGWHGHRRGLQFAVRRDKLVQRSERSAGKFLSDGIGARDITIHDAQQADGFSLLLELLVDTRVIAPKGTHADYCYIDDVVGSQRRSRAAGCRR
jgi:hypothetical protein